MTSQHDLDRIQRAAVALVEAAKLSDVILTIETKPLQPLAMGHHEMIIDVRAARQLSHPKPKAVASMQRSGIDGAPA